MDFKDLQCFLALVEELNFTRAAARMHMAQPPFSQRIRRLEEAVGVRLFDRNNKSVRCTDAGHTFEAHARQLLGAARNAVQSTRQVEQGVAGRVSLGAIYSSVYRAVPDIIKAMAEQYPAVELQVEEMSVEAQLAAIRKGTIDGGILRLMRSEADIATETLFRESYLVAVSNEDAISRRSRGLTLKDVAAKTLIAFEPSFSPEYEAIVFAAFVSAGLEPAQVRRVRSMHMMLGFVSAGAGVAIVPSSLAGIQLQRVTYVPLKDRLPAQEVRLAWLRSSPPPIVLRLAERVRAIRHTWVNE
ncbi:MAG: LysR substrate-binding domain-containing protein [Pigmentiphaga sp.]|uniref:LysR substrate-binding domain-containing protein n=1 Tax=Pigmentiphaga sp. TaxID=1977564 RepID=UPI0029B21C25|nr:LysR substrate-binding domain-containing protein [Pigmentiphaga sp.]MDX3906325.1 LysR substrate-binding domain-containing protein [Pigmentiphaga sp.]